MEEKPFDAFTFEELMNMVITISRTKKRSSDMMWSEGTNLHAIDDLEANVDNILAELVGRVTQQWSMDRIQQNFASSTIMLPNQLMNIFSITRSDLNNKIRTRTIGADNNDGYDEIWFMFARKKYKMSRSGKILIE